MRTPLLVLVRWHGDVIATHTVEQGRNVQSFGFLDGLASDKVGVEVHDVTPERLQLGHIAPKADLRAVYGLVVSGVLHLALGIVAAAFLLFHSSGEPLESADANRRGATVEADTTQIAANEGADAGLPQPKSAAQVREEPPAPPPPPPVAPVPLVEPSELGDPAERDEPRPKPKPEMKAPLTAEAMPPSKAPASDAEPGDELGSESPSSGGQDAASTSRATCTAVRAPKNSGPICHRTVVMTSLDVPPSCYTDTIMHPGQTGTLSFPCSGDGEATLSFGRRSFKGASLGGKLEMCAGTEYPFSDGCRWTSAQRVSGSVAGQTLSFNYGEAPKGGETARRTCAQACSAHGTVVVK